MLATPACRCKHAFLHSVHKVKVNCASSLRIESTRGELSPLQASNEAQQGWHNSWPAVHRSWADSGWGPTLRMAASPALLLAVPRVRLCLEDSLWA